MSVPSHPWVERDSVFMWLLVALFVSVVSLSVAAYNMGRADAERSVICEKPGT